jgi:hypothetical protein
MDFPLENIQVLVDDPTWATEAPTKDNILNAMRWLVSNTQHGDNLVFFYSGHGGHMRYEDRFEVDGLDQAIIPVDYHVMGHIHDSLIFDTMVKPLSTGVRMTLVMDCYEGGQLLDLPYVFRASEQNTQEGFPGGRFDPRAIPPMATNMKWQHALRSKFTRQNNQYGQEFVYAMQDSADGFHREGLRHPHADVCLIAVVKDAHLGATQSYGGWGQAGGACTAAMTAVLNEKTRLTYFELLEGMRKYIRVKGFDQVPQISSTKPINLAGAFSFIGPLPIDTSVSEANRSIGGPFRVEGAGSPYRGRGSPVRVRNFDTAGSSYRVAGSPYRQGPYWEMPGFPDQLPHERLQHGNPWITPGGTAVRYIDTALY